MNRSCLLILLSLVVSPQAAEVEISADTTLDPAKTYGPIVIKASNITIDGRGASIVGATKGTPKDYTGVGIRASGVSGVTLRNVKVKGFETGLRVENAEKWAIEGCDFSDNFHDPDFGWGENGRRGGIVLTRVTKSALRRCKAGRNWDGCSLDRCDENTIEDCDFSRCSNTCLKLWASSRNIVRKNTLSYGLRIAPREVHARDSTSVLIESGSNDNRFLDNDCTHGGDGIFVRILNGWVCTGNWFEGNDVSYANNNGFEAWSPRNTYVRNKANHCSYGFWLGASDKTVLIGNEAAHNGDPKGFHNSPHLPGRGHAGIVFMFGPSSHTVVRGNHVHHNHGAGIAAIGHQETKGAKFRAFHWIIEQNRIEDNRWGVYLEHADWVDLAANDFARNTEDVRNAGGVTNLTERPANAKISRPPKASLAGPAGTIKAGEKAAFDASASADPDGHALSYRWDLGDGTTSTAPKVEHAYRAPGFYRLGLTVSNGLLSDLAWMDVYVVEDLGELGTESGAAEWSWVDAGSTCAFADDGEHRISGKASTRALVSPYSGGRCSLLYPKSKKGGWPLEGRSHLVFWMKFVNENLPAWQGENPVVTLHECEDAFLRLTPAGDFLSDLPYIEGREGWTYFVVPLAGDERWKREGRISTVNWITIGVDSWGAPPLRIWIDGMALK